MSREGSKHASRKKESERPKGDLYHTPKSLVWALFEKESFSNVWEPASGFGSITEELCLKYQCLRRSTDIIMGTNFLEKHGEWQGDILTNPPFSKWDEFVLHAKAICNGRICMIGRTNYFGTKGRIKSGVWKGLRYVYVFNRMVDYQTPYRVDGCFHVGSLVTGWFIWENHYQGEPVIRQLDVDDYATLGSFKKRIPIDNASIK